MRYHQFHDCSQCLDTVNYRECCSLCEVIVIVSNVSLLCLLCQLPATAQASRHRRQTGDGSGCIDIEKGEQCIFFICYKTLASTIKFCHSFS
jgi:hypothetical protein